MKESEWTNYETTITYAFLDATKEQFHRLRVSDPLFYEWDPDLSQVLDEIRNTTLTDVILRNTGIEGMVCLSMISEQHWLENSEEDFTASEDYCVNENLNFMPGPPIEINNPTQDRSTVLNAKMTERTARSGLGGICLLYTSDAADE